MRIYSVYELVLLLVPQSPSSGLFRGFSLIWEGGRDVKDNPVSTNIMKFRAGEETCPALMGVNLSTYSDKKKNHTGRRS